MSLLRIGFAALILSTSLQAEPFLVKNGQARAEIVISENPQRSTRLAAHDLQLYLNKISGARLPIVFSPSETVPVQIFLGDSDHTKKLGITSEGLEAGAYRIVSGNNWLTLIGDDTDFVPIEPWAKNNTEIVNGTLQKAWEEKAGFPWGVPNRGKYKHRERGLPNNIGLPDHVEVPKDERFEVWNFDERGSYNAVCGFLRQLGVRWYLPGELGEVVPELYTIPLPKIDEVVKPDFPIRQFNVRFSTVSDPTMWWFMRLGIRQPYGLMIAHGMHAMTHTEEILTKNPNWFALYGGKRDTQLGERLNHLCYSNEELFESTVGWARAQFDIYNYKTASIMPPDAYIAICQCDLCEGKDVPEMGSRGKLSNHVWDFVNRVAKEVAKTHPDKTIVCCAYGANTNPPTNIDQLEPNVQVIIVGGRRPRNSLPEQREEIQKLRAGWLEKTTRPLMVFENYPITGRGFYLPAYTPKAIIESIEATKGISEGEDIWLSIAQDFETRNVGFNHFQVYFTARSYWGGKGLDADAMLQEYCQQFYGPAGDAMNAFFEYCEPNWQAMENEIERVNEALTLFAKAKENAPKESVYAKRLELIDDFLEELRKKSALLSQKRGPVTKLRTVWEPKEPIVIDGKLDEAYWQNCPASSKGSLRELQTGGLPSFGTTVMAAWDRGGHNLYFAIQCDENPSEKPNIATEENEDQSIWYGDLIEILLDTDAHRYYQIAVNPAGALIDLDRAADKNSWLRWQSQAEVATHIADDHWTVEIRIPVTDDENDPLNQVIGRKPSQSLPWHFNVCRQRIRENGKEHSSFSPTGTASFHEPMKFAQFYDGRSHAFDVDDSVTDYLIETRKAEDLERKRKPEEAIRAWEQLAAAEGITERQQSHALSRATFSARQLRDFDKATALAAKISNDAIRETALMEVLLSQRETEKLIEQFGKIDFANWSFWQRGAGAYARGRAFAILKEGQRAESDLSLALDYTSDPRIRSGILASLGHNRESNLQDDEGALEAYRMNFIGKERIGGADEFRSVQNAARILTRQQKFDKSLSTLRLIDTKNTQGTWRYTTLLLEAEILAAAGRKEKARESLRALLADEKLDKRTRETATKLLDVLP